MNEFKEAKTLYAENQKTLLKEVKEHISKWKAIPSLWIGRLDFVKMTILPKVTYRFNAILVKIPMAFFCRNRRAHLKILMGSQRPQNSKNNLENEE